MQDIRVALLKILQLEEQGDWGGVERGSLNLIEAIAGGEIVDPPVGVYRYLDDFDVRRKDRKYGEMQRAELRAFLNS